VQPTRCVRIYTHVSDWRGDRSADPRPGFRINDRRGGCRIDGSSPAWRAVLKRATQLAASVLANPKRFAAFATLPWQDPEAAATELERTVKQLGMVGTLLGGRPGRTFLDDPHYEPVLATLNELKVPIYLHPGFSLPQVREPYYGGLDREVGARLSMFGWGWHSESATQVIRIILTGTFERYPDLHVISGHWGEMVPFYLQRMDDTIPQEATRLSRSITETYKSHMFIQRDKEQIAHGNAEALLGL